jgi:hypothetical protein
MEGETELYWCRGSLASDLPGCVIFSCSAQLIELRLVPAISWKLLDQVAQ